MSECGDNITSSSELSRDQAEELLKRAKNLAETRSLKSGIPIDEALRQIAGELRAEEKTMSMIHERNMLLSIRAKKQVKEYVSRFKTMGSGLLAFLQGSVRGEVQGARLSVDYQAKATHGKYFGSLVAQMEDAGVLNAFKHADDNLTRDIYREMGSSHPGQPAKSVTGNDSAFKIAQIIDSVSQEMVARQNRAGAYIKQLPGYITRQTHSQEAIRALGGVGNSPSTKAESYRQWREFVLPLLDKEKTMMGEDTEKFMRNIHEALYSGIHGAAREEMDVQGLMLTGNLAKKISQGRVLHFRDADSAFAYNQAFGIKDFKEQVMHDIHVRARSISMMENLGPTPESTLGQIVRELQDVGRTQEDAALQVDSLRDWRIKAAMNEITGRNEISASPSLSNMTGTLKVLAQLAKMGAVTLASFTDKAFLQSEMAYQGINHLNTLMAQVTGMARRSKDKKQFLRLMGVGMESLLGNALSRYSNHSTVSGWGHTAQKWFFNLNFLNAWTDANKSTAAELMAAHLGEHSKKTFAELPGELSRVLSQYEITSSRWDALRSTAYDHGVGKFITPDQVDKIPGNVFRDLVVESGRKPTEANILRERDALETALRTYVVDRADIAVPTPGAAERKYSTWDTQAGTPLGEALRMMMLFKSFPITVLRKIVGREIYGRGADSMKDWLLHDHMGKFHLAQLIAMSTMLGYGAGAMRDALKGRTPKPLISDGKINWTNLNDAALRGGSLGILGDALMAEYANNYGSMLERAAGPIVGQLDSVAEMKTQLFQGKNIGVPAEKLLLDNAPLINLFYIRPVLDYFVLWNMQEMLSPGSLRRMESAVERRNHQEFFLRPSDAVNK